MATATAATRTTMATMAATRTDALAAPARLRARGLSLWQAAWLCLCLLLAQHAGLVHRVEHGGVGMPGTNASLAVTTAATTAVNAAGTTAGNTLGTTAGTTASTASTEATTEANAASANATTDADDATPLVQKATTHSCVLFDGAATADLHCGGLAPPVLAYGKPVNPAALAWRWPDLPPRHPFRSRAPPALAFQA